MVYVCHGNSAFEFPRGPFRVLDPRRTLSHVQQPAGSVLGIMNNLSNGGSLDPDAAQLAFDLSPWRV